ncbi:hypothetical protein Tco_1249669 [Tanacetum coccineum]
MACSLSHTIDEIKAFVQKLMNEDIIHQKAIMKLAVQFDNASTAKDNLRKAYKTCNGIPQESRALIDNFLKQESDKDCKMHLAMYTNEPNEVRAAILRRLRTEQEKELQLVNNLLGEMTRYLLRKRSRAEEQTRAAREEVIRSMDERQELINNYRAI